MLNRGRAVLACVFPYFVTMKKLTKEGFDLILEDGVLPLELFMREECCVQSIRPTLSESELNGVHFVYL